MLIKHCGNWNTYLYRYCLERMHGPVILEGFTCYSSFLQTKLDGSLRALVLQAYQVVGDNEPWLPLSCLGLVESHSHYVILCTILILVLSRIMDN